MIGRYEYEDKFIYNSEYVCPDELFIFFLSCVCVWRIYPPIATYVPSYRSLVLSV
jgi:hypothetical protein